MIWKLKEEGLKLKEEELKLKEEEPHGDVMKLFRLKSITMMTT